MAFLGFEEHPIAMVSKIFLQKATLHFRARWSLLQFLNSAVIAEKETVCK